MSKEKLMFPEIYELPQRPSSDCEHFKVLERGSNYVAWCSAVERYIVKYAVNRCQHFWATCPFRKAYRG